GDVVVDRRDAIFGTTTAVPLRVAVEEVLAEWVRLVVLVDPDPSHEFVPHDRVHPRVLECRGRESRRVPADGLQRRVDEHDAEAEAEMDDRFGLGVVQCADSLVDVLSSLSNRRLRDDADALAATRTSQVLQIAFADQVLLDKNSY